MIKNIVRKIDEKRTGNIIYRLICFGSNSYVIYEHNEELWGNGKVHRGFRKAVFSNKEKAREYLEKLTR